MIKHLLNNQKHSFHIVTPSPWPILAALVVFMITIGFVMVFHGYSGYFLIDIGFCLIFMIAYLWWYDIVAESTFLGYHTVKVVKGLRLGMILFIISEVMFFFSFFWAFFHSSLAPHIFLGAIWPPIGIFVLNPLSVPLVNTFVLLLSGFFVTVSHYSLCVALKMHQSNDRVDCLYSLEPLSRAYLAWNRQGTYWIHLKDRFISPFSVSFLGLSCTIILAFEFTLLQWHEYHDALFCINDGVYGSTFYLTTGFHGLHVIIGTLF